MSGKGVDSPHARIGAVRVAAPLPDGCVAVVGVGAERRVLEVRTYLGELRGASKKKESIFDIFKVIGALKQRLDALQTRLVAAELKQRDYLAQVAVQELEQQQARLAAYQIQARFALGTMYDRAASSQDAARPQKPAAPQQKAAEGEETPHAPEPPQ